MNTTEKQLHIPVMAKETISFLIPDNNKQYDVIDCTLGYGGHSSMFLKKNPNIKLLGIDRDINAIQYSKNRLEFAADRIILEQGRFSDVLAIANEVGWTGSDAVLLDIGVSSPQIDEAARGFSFRFKAPLDMRMDRKHTKTASQILNHSSIEGLAHIFRNYGEVKKPWKLAEAIVERRKVKPWMHTFELADLCEDILPKPRKGGLPAPTLCFQALRIAVNEELTELEDSIYDIIELLNPGGRIAVISYHSLEDRIAKQIFKSESTDCLCPPGLPVCICGHKAKLKLLTKKPLGPTLEETQINRRSASAKMRVAQKL